MQTRRELLKQSIVLPLAARRFSGSEILTEPDCLSLESARGFSGVSLPGKRFVVVCGAGSRAMARAPELLRRAIQGEWIIWENSPQFRVQEVFGMRLGAPLNAGLYIHYSWPRREMTRSFLQAIPVVCSDSEVIARHAGMPVAMKRRFGRGGVVFLGSMLGPNLCAEEPEARRIIAGLLRELM